MSKSTFNYDLRHVMKMCCPACGQGFEVVTTTNLNPEQYKLEIDYLRKENDKLKEQLMTLYCSPRNYNLS